jgi:hypothetical protein
VRGLPLIYPALEVPARESWNNSELASVKGNVPQMLDFVNQVTQRSFLLQLSFVQNLSLKLFKDLYGDISRVHERIKSLGGALPVSIPRKHPPFASSNPNRSLPFFYRPETSTTTPAKAALP